MLASNTTPDVTRPQYVAPYSMPPATSPKPWGGISTWDEFAARPLTIEARLGFGTPLGLAGIATEYSLIPAFGLGCGAGTNAPNRSGAVRFT